MDGTINVPPEFNEHRPRRNHANDLKTAPTAPVWDLGVRLFHWTLVISVTAALATGFFAPRPWLDLHLVFGGTVAALITYRLIWGFTGSTYARLTSFVVMPWTALKYAIKLVSGRAPHHIGHNPLGATMIVALVLTLAALTATGLVSLGGGLKDGPLAPFTTYAIGTTAKDLHEIIAFLLLGLISFHVFGIIIESARTRENLVRTMVTGAKRITPDAIHHTHRHAWPKLTAIAVLISGTCAAAAIITGSMRPALGVASTPLDSAYVKECAACHTPHHPSLASTATWRALMSDLGNHFGDNAELDPALAKTIEAYLVTNSAETSDTKAANILRAQSSDTRLRITEAAAWRKIHTSIDPATFSLKAISGKHNCAACHADAATGVFKARSIAIPKEISK